MHTRYRAIARVTKAHGRRGEVVTVPVHGLPPLLRDGLEVYVVPPALKGPRSRVVRSARGDEAGMLASLSGVDDLDAAERLVGRTLLARWDDLPHGFELHDPDALVGKAVKDSRLGDLGSITEVMRGPANDVWVVDGPKGEVLLPVIDEVVSSVPAAGPIQVSVPEGLIGGGR